MYSLFDLLIVIGHVFILVILVTGLMVLVAKGVPFFFRDEVNNLKTGESKMLSSKKISRQDGDLFISLVFGIYIGLLTNIWVTILFKWLDAINQGSKYTGMNYFPYVVGGAAIMIFFTIVFYLLYVSRKK